MLRTNIVCPSLAVAAVMALLPVIANGQGSSPPRVAVRPGTTQPGTQPAVAEQGPQVIIQTPEALEPILKLWEQKTAGITSIKGDFERITYDYVFNVEKRATGEYWFETPDKARMDFHPDKRIIEWIEKNPGKTPIIDRNGEKFQVAPDEPSSWYCTGEHILSVKHNEKQIERMEIPQNYRGQRITDGPMPFLFGMKADAVKQRYAMTFGTMHDPQKQIHIVAKPLVIALQREFSRAEILLNPVTFMPTHVKLWDPVGTKQTTYIFESPKPFNIFQQKIAPPWQPRLIGYDIIIDQKAEPDLLPMQEQRSTFRPGGSQTSEGNSPIKIQ